MPNLLDASGLQIKTNSDIVGDLTTALQGIYGTDINLSQNSPDGQLLNIVGQAATDVLELLAAVYNSFSVNSAFGVTLDQRVALNGVSRRQGTYTITPVSVTVSKALNLQGLDAAANDPNGTGFTVSDDAGNQFILAASVSIGSPGTSVLNFRAKSLGAVETTLNTITNQVTVVQGVTGVNNPSALTTLGVNEESDVELKLRHARSFALASTGGADAVQAALLSIPAVTDALVVENDTNGTVNSILAHSIWCIVENGAGADIGSAIYSKKAPGCGMKGSQSAVVTRPNGATFTAAYDVPISENLYVQFTIVARTAGATFDHPTIAAALAAALTYKLGQSPSVGDIVVAMLVIAPQAILTDVGVSTDGITYASIVSPTTSQHKFAASSGRITIS